MRRADKQMSDSAARELLASGYSGRLATVGSDGWPYIVPLLYVMLDEDIVVHTSQARGHFRNNIDHDARACFQLDKPGDVFGYGRFECDTSISYASVVAFGSLRALEDRDAKTRFCVALMQKYAGHISGRPKQSFPRLDGIAVYAMQIERLTGKESTLPAVAQQWPNSDRTKTPTAVT